VLGFRAAGSAALKPCPSARPGVQPEWVASRGTGCTERARAWRKLGGSHSEGRWGQRPKQPAAQRRDNKGGSPSLCHRNWLTTRRRDPIDGRSMIRGATDL